MNNCILMQGEGLERLLVKGKKEGQEQLPTTRAVLAEVAGLETRQQLLHQ